VITLTPVTLNYMKRELPYQDMTHLTHMNEHNAVVPLQFEIKCRESLFAHVG